MILQYRVDRGEHTGGDGLPAVQQEEQPQDDTEAGDTKQESQQSRCEGNPKSIPNIGVQQLHICSRAPGLRGTTGLLVGMAVEEGGL